MDCRCFQRPGSRGGGGGVPSGHPGCRRVWLCTASDKKFNFANEWYFGIGGQLCAAFILARFVTPIKGMAPVSPLGNGSARSAVDSFLFVIPTRALSERYNAKCQSGSDRRQGRLFTDNSQRAWHHVVNLHWSTTQLGRLAVQQTRGQDSPNKNAANASSHVECGHM